MDVSKVTEILSKAVIADEQYAALDAAKHRAAAQMVEYDQFKELVAGAHLAPVNKKKPTDSEQTGTGSGGGSGSGGGANGAAANPFAARAAGQTALQTNEAATKQFLAVEYSDAKQRLLDASNQSADVKPPVSVDEWKRDWLRLPELDDRFSYLQLRLEPALIAKPDSALRTLCAESIDEQILTLVIDVIHHQLITRTASASSTIDAKSSDAKPITRRDAVLCYRMLYGLTAAKRFSLTLPLGSSDKPKLEASLKALTAWVQRTPASDVDGITTQLIAALRGLYELE